MSKWKGEVSTSNVPCIEVTWKIPNFTKTSRKLGYRVESPPFSFAGASWNLKLLPNGLEGCPDVIFIYLLRLDSSVSEHSVIARMGFKTDRGEEYRSFSTEGLVDEYWHFLFHCYPKTSLVDAGDFLFSTETVTVFCQLRLKTQPREALLELPVIDGRLDTSGGSQNIAGNSEATHSVSPQPVLMNSNTHTDRLRPNSQENLGCYLSEWQEFELQVSTSNVPCIEVKWKIPNFAQISKEIGYTLRSPPFYAAQASWVIRLRPNGTKSYPDCILIGLQLTKPSVSDYSVTARICFKTDRGEEYRSVCTEGLLNKYCYILFLRYEKRSHVEACDFLIPKGTATVFCQLRLITEHREALLESPLRQDRSLEASSSNDVFARDRGATHSASSQTDEPHPNSPVRWQTRIKSISEGACHKVYETKEFSDVKIRVQGIVFDAHRLILAGSSSEFARLLMSPTAIDEIIVDRSSPVTANGFGLLLHYIYKNGLNTTNKKSIIEGYLAAKYFKQEAMQIACSEGIESWEITEDEVCDLLDIDCGIEALEERCFSYVRNNGLAVITSDSFPKASFKSLCVILKSGALKDMPALEKIRCVMKWGKHHNPSASDYSPVRKLLLQCQPPLLGMLEFEKLTVEDLDDVFEEYKGLLLDNEFPKFVSYITKKKQVLPSWCSAAV